jgi:hypothetical protein
MGFPGPGKAALQLKYLRHFFERLPFSKLVPSDELTTNGYCLALKPDIFIFYFPEGGSAEIILPEAGKKLTGYWYDPASGLWTGKINLRKGNNRILAPKGKDMTLLVTRGAPAKIVK